MKTVQEIRDEYVEVKRQKRLNPDYCPVEDTRINWRKDIAEGQAKFWRDAKPFAWDESDFKDGHRIIPKTIPIAGAFAKGECGWQGEELYRSLYDRNVDTPREYPDGWELVVTAE